LPNDSVYIVFNVFAVFVCPYFFSIFDWSSVKIFSKSKKSAEEAPASLVTEQT
jgi:hypothetical protein